MSKSLPVHDMHVPEFAIHDVALAMGSIFRPLFRGHRPKGLNIECDGFKGKSLQITCFEGLDVRDQSVLLGLCGLAGMSRKKLSANSDGEEGRSLWSALKPCGQAAVDEVKVVSTTFYQVRLAARFTDNGRDGYQRLRDILYRLSQVGCRVRSDDGYDWSMQLLSYLSNSDGDVSVALNSRFAKALLAGGQHVRTSLVERHSLPNEIAQLLHCHLTAWVRAGSSQKSRIDLLAKRLWGEMSVNEATTRKRRKTVREALTAVGDLPGWSVQIGSVGVRQLATIQRPLKRNT